jgi:hypothetical protein
MTPFSYRLRCTACRTEIFITANRNDAARTKTPFVVRCPACEKEVSGAMPVSIDVETVQLVSYERPAGLEAT